MRHAAATIALTLTLTARAGSAQDLLELKWIWTLPEPSLAVAVLVDVDGDGSQEIVSSNGAGVQCSRVSDGKLVQVWSTLPFENEVTALAFAASAEGSGGEVLAASGFQILSFDAATGDSLRTIELTNGWAGRLRVDDIEGDGGREIIGCGNTVSILDFASGTLLRSTSGPLCETLQLGQFDGDSQLELLLSGRDAGAWILDGVSLTSEWTLPAPAARRALAGQLDATGPLEILTSGDDEVLRAWNGLAGEQLWEHQGFTLFGSTTSDIGRDAAEEVLVAERYPPGEQMVVLDGRTGTETDSYPWSRLSWMVVGQTDEDAALELVAATGLQSSESDRLLVFDLSNAALEASTPGFGQGFFSLSAARLGADRPVELFALAPPHDAPFSTHPFVSWNAATGELLGTMLYPTGLDGVRGTMFGGAVELDGDGEPEFLAGVSDWSRDGVVRFDRGAEDPDWLLMAPDDSIIGDFRIAEIDGDSPAELFLSISREDDGLRFYSFATENGWIDWGSTSVTQALPGPRVDFEIGDIDADGEEELVYLGGRFFTPFFGILSALDGTEELPAGGSLHLSDVELLQLDADLELEIVVSESFGDLLILDPKSGTIESTIADIDLSIDLMAAADWSRDGVSDFVVVGNRQLVGIDGTSGAVAWIAPFLGERPGDLVDLLAFDAEGNGLPDLAVACTWGIAVFEIPQISVFSDGFESGDTSQWSSTSTGRGSDAGA